MYIPLIHIYLIHLANRPFPTHISYISNVDRVVGIIVPTSDNAVFVTHQTACGVTLCDAICAIGLCGVGTKPHRKS